MCNDAKMRTQIYRIVMRSQVFRAIRTVAEHLHAAIKFASIWPLKCVRTLVDFQILQPREGFVASDKLEKNNKKTIKFIATKRDEHINSNTVDTFSRL